MLLGKNVVIIKSEDKNTPSMVTEYDRVYLEFASTDPVEEYEKTSDKEPLKVNGQVWKGVRPKDEKTSVSAKDLVGDALAYFQATYPVAPTELSEDALKKMYPGIDLTQEIIADERATIIGNHAWIMLLEAASYGNDLWVRGKIQSEIRPSKPLDINAGVEKMVKVMVAMGVPLEVARVNARQAAGLPPL